MLKKRLKTLGLRPLLPIALGLMPLPMIELVPINVESYSGYKADEYPKCFYWNNNKFEIKEIIDRWYQLETNPGAPASDYFKVETTSGIQYLIKHDPESDQWHLCLHSTKSTAI